MELHAIGIDLGKTLFHLVGLDASGKSSFAKGVRERNYWRTP